MTSYASKIIVPVDSLFRTYCTQYEALYFILITRSSGKNSIWYGFWDRIVLDN